MKVNGQLPIVVDPATRAGQGLVDIEKVQLQKIEQQQKQQHQQKIRIPDEIETVIEKQQLNEDSGALRAAKTIQQGRVDKDEPQQQASQKALDAYKGTAVLDYNERLTQLIGFDDYA